MKASTALFALAWLASGLAFATLGGWYTACIWLAVNVSWTLWDLFRGALVKRKLKARNINKLKAKDFNSLFFIYSYLKSLNSYKDRAVMFCTGGKWYVFALGRPSDWGKV